MGVKNSDNDVDPVIEMRQRKFKVLKLDVKNDLTYLQPLKEEE